MIEETLETGAVPVEPDLTANAPIEPSGSPEPDEPLPDVPLPDLLLPDLPLLEPGATDATGATAGAGGPPPDEPGQGVVEPISAPAPEGSSPTEPSTDQAGVQAPRTAGRFVADALRAAGVRIAFTVPGESFLGLLDALGDAGIRVVATRHEGGAGFMAEAYGQLTGRPAACLATRAVGASNLAIGIHTARQDSTPMFALVGQVPREFRGREAFQEIDIAGTIGRLAAWAVEIDDVARLPGALAEATRHALGGRPGPVVISLPEDFLDDLIDPGLAVAPIVREHPPEPSPDAIRATLHGLSEADRPLILVGGGVLRARATADLVKLAEILEVPVVTAWRRADAFPNDHPLYLGMTGYGAPPTVQERLTEADALLVVGSRVNEITSYGYTLPRPASRWTHVDLAPRSAVAGLDAPDRAIAADARTFMRLAARLLAGAVHDKAHLDRRRAANEADRAAWEAATVVDAEPWSGPGVHPGRIVADMGRILPPEAIITTDAGNFGGWVARGYRWRRPGTFLGPTSGAMGYGLPAGIAAALVHRDRPVVAVAGDGGFAMTMAELETAVRERLRLTVLVFDNRRYGTIGMHQDARGTGLRVATDLGPIDFAAVAEGFGARGVRIDDDTAFGEALRESLGADRPTVIHLPLDRRWVSVDRIADDPG